MSLNRTEKAAVIDEVKAQIVNAQTLVVAEYRGTKVADMTKLRKSAREQGLPARVENTLARRAVVGTPFEVAAGEMAGPLIYGFSVDAVAAARVISDFAKTNDKIVVKAGAFDGKLLDKAGVASLASIPSKGSCWRSWRPPQLAGCPLRTRPRRRGRKKEAPAAEAAAA